LELWSSVEAAAVAALADAGLGASELDAVGIANQRETTIVWDRSSGEPVHRAIVWQDRRTAERCRQLAADEIRLRTGLTPDPYFSATKLEWILREVASSDGLAFGTVDSWLLWQLTGGGVHATDVSNASRTMLLDLATLDWNDALLELFSVPRALLPEVRPSASVFGEGNLLGVTLPIAALAGDQQASLFAHGGGAKATFGTGAFVLVGTGADCSTPPHGLVRTAAAGTVRVRARRVRIHRRGGGAMAPRRSRCARDLRRERGARALDRFHRRRLLRACAHRGSVRRTGRPTRAA
jgi:Glycerol kinase